MEKWALALIIVATVLVGAVVLKKLLQTWAASAYKRMLKNPLTACDIDAFVGYDRNPVSALKCVLAHKMQIGSRKASTEPIPLEAFESPHVPGLRVSRKKGENDTSNSTAATATTATTAIDIHKLIAESGEKTPIVIATIRMGFGHHRLAYSVSSWAIEAGHPAIFHDLLSIKSGTYVVCYVSLRCFATYERLR